MYCTNIATENWTTWLSFAGELGFFVKNIRSLSSIDSIETVYLCEREGRVEPSGSTIYICICAICVTKTLNHVAVLSNLDVVLSNCVVVLSTHDAVLSLFGTSWLFSRLKTGTLEASETDFDTWHLTSIMTPQIRNFQVLCKSYLTPTFPLPKIHPIFAPAVREMADRVRHEGLGAGLTASSCGVRQGWTARFNNICDFCAICVKNKHFSVRRCR